MRYFTLFVCILAACLSLLFVYRTTITEKIIADRLQAIGCENIQVIVTGLNGHSLSITSLYATFPDNSPLQRIQLHNLALLYNLRQILDGTVAKLEIDTLQVTLNKQKKRQAGKPASPKDIRPYLPEAISIRNLILSGPEIEGDLSLQVHLQNSSDNPLDIELGITGRNILLPGWKVSTLTGKLFLETDNGSIISLQENSHIEIDGLQGRAASLQKAHLLLSGKLTSTPDNGWLAGPASVVANTKGLQLRDLLIQPSSLSLQLEEQISLTSPLQFHSSVAASKLVLQWQDKTIALKDIQIDFEAKDDTLQLSALISHALVPGQIEASASHDLAENMGEVHFTTPLPFTLGKEEAHSNQLVTGLELPFLLNNGLIDCNGSMQWQDNKTLLVNAGFTLHDGAGEYKNIRFSDLHIQQNLQLFPEICTVQPGTVLLGEIYNGFTVNTIEIHNQIVQTTDTQHPTLLIDLVQAELLGGTVNSKDIRIDPVQQDLDILVNLNGIALDKVVNLNKMKGLSVTGIVDGTIRVQRKDRKFSIPEGELHSRKPGGTISYLPPGGTASLSQFPAYAMKALQEFNYDTLSLTPKYDPDGMLRIAIHTEGHSPPLNTTRPVHLNLTTEQNLLSLLQSLRYSKSLTDDLEKRLQTRQLKK